MARPSTVIKASSTASVPAPELKLHTFHITDVMQEAAAALEAAQAEAATILQKARQQAEAMKTAARETGYKEGLDQGTAEGRKSGHAQALESARQEFAGQHQQLIQACRQIIDMIEAQRAAWYAAARQDLIDLVMAIARRVVHHVGQTHREAVLANLEEAVRIVGARSDVVIAVHPEDAKVARAFAQSLLDLKEQWKHVRVVAEPEVSPGGCRIHWGTGAIDSMLDTQLDRIAAELKGDTAPADRSTPTVEEQ